MQTRLQSLCETLSSIGVGFVLALGLQILLARLYHAPLSLQTNLEWTVWFTLLSIIRSYAMRRFFNWLHSKDKS